MAVILNEAAADKQVIKSLLNEINRLRGTQMSKILRDTDGNLYRVEHYEQITTDELEAEAINHEAKANELREFLHTNTPEVTPPTEPQAPVAQPEVPAPAPVPTPTPEAPQVAPVPAPAPVAEETAAPDPTAPAPTLAPAPTVLS